MTHDFVLEYSAASDPGLRRRQNEDSAFASPRLLAVADGIGGHPNGDVASAAVVSTMAELDEHLARDGHAYPDVVSALSAGASEAARRVVRLAERDPALHGMGTTLTALLSDGHRFALAHVGDSRAYLLRAGSLVPLTRDHTLTQSLVDDGTLTQDQVADHPRRSMLVRAMQTAGPNSADITVHEPRQGDRYLLCSDGLTDVIDDDALHALLSTPDSPAATVVRLVDAANAAGGPDNITCVVCDVGTGPAVHVAPTVLGAAASAAPAAADGDTARIPRPSGAR